MCEWSCPGSPGRQGQLVGTAVVSIPRRPIRLGPGRSTPHPSDAPAAKHAPATPIPSGLELQLPGPCALHPQGLLGTVVPEGGGAAWALGCFTGQPRPASLPSDSEKQHSGLRSTCCVRPGAALWKEEESHCPVFAIHNCWGQLPATLPYCIGAMGISGVTQKVKWSFC